MSRVGVEQRSDRWHELEIYRQRYGLIEELRPLNDLQNSLDRRRARESTLERKKREVTKHLTEVTAELSAVRSEIEGTLVAGELLIEDILDRVRNNRDERWSPVPVRGFRVWRIEENQIKGNQVHWFEPSLESYCLRQIPGEDLPHAENRCGPPACGIYAVKDLDWFPTEVGNATINNSVVGVVALSGKVIEHTDGYRAARARVMAVSARSRGRRIMTEDVDTIASLFDDPCLTMDRLATNRDLEDERIREFLETAKRKEQQWI